MLTNEQRQAMRSEVIGPCTKNEIAELKTWLVKNKEGAAKKEWWLNGTTVLYDEQNNDWMAHFPTSYAPTISFSDFKTKYIDATKS